jgi:hypothetical protein
MNYDIFFASITIVIPLISIALSLKKIVAILIENCEEET